MTGNKSIGLFILGGAGLLYFLSAGRAKAATHPRGTTGTAKAPVDSYDRQFASRAQQPVLGGASGGAKANIDLTGVGSAVWSALRKASSGIGGVFKSSSSNSPNPTGNDTQPGDRAWYDRYYPSDPELQIRRDTEAAAAGEFDNYGTVYDESLSKASTDYGGGDEFDASFESSTKF